MAQIFISYSRKDLTFIERLAADLHGYGFTTWYDLSNLGAGDRWNKIIEKAIVDSQYVIVVLSPDSVESEYVDAEITFARRWQKKIVPLYYLPCELGMLYINLNYIDVQGGNYNNNFQKILHALNAPTTNLAVEEKPARVGRVSNPTGSFSPKQSQAESLTYESRLDKLTLSNGMEFMRVPAGKFLMGSQANDWEAPHLAIISYDFWMSRFPVTNIQYRRIKEKSFERSKENHPVVHVSWNDAMEYCRRINELFESELPSGFVLRLPTESEWEKAARGAEGREYPWGNKFDKSKCNTNEGGKGSTTSVGGYSPEGDSPYGCADMSGNVWEWTHSLKKPYPYIDNDGRENEQSLGARVLRGGSFFDYEFLAFCSYRAGSPIKFSNFNVGFRIALAPPIHS